MINLNIPDDFKNIKDLKAGQIVKLNGTIYTARDAAHKNMYNALTFGEALPFDLNLAAIYYSGPCPAPKKYTVGSCGPTTSARVDFYTPLLIENGLKMMIGKGPRNKDVVDSIVKFGAVYLAAIGGAGALYAKCVTKNKVVAYPKLLSEAVHQFTIKDFPAVVAIDSNGGSIYK